MTYIKFNAATRQDADSQAALWQRSHNYQLRFAWSTGLLDPKQVAYVYATNAELG